MSSMGGRTKRLARIFFVLALFFGASNPLWAYSGTPSNAHFNGMILPVDVATAGYSLSGQWQFSPGDDMQWLSPDYDDSGWSEMAVPGRWPRGGFPDSDQFAWYRLTLQFDLKNPQQRELLSDLGIRMGKVMSSYELYVGGRLLGGVGKLPPMTQVNYDREAVYSIPMGAIDESGKLVIAMRVWGGEALSVHNFGSGAYDGEFKIGNYSALLHSEVVGQIPGVLVAVLFIAFGLYHLYLHRRNRQLDTYLWFGLMAVNVGIYALMLNQSKYLVDWSFIAYKKTEFGAIYLFPAVGMQLLWKLLDLPFNRVVRTYQLGFVLSALVVVLVPGMDIHYVTLVPWELYTVPLVLYCPWIIIKKTREGNAEARTALIGVMIFLATCLNDLSLDLAWTDTPRLLPFGFIAVMLSMAISLANRFTNVLNSLEDEVAERTSELQSANIQLAKAARHDPLTHLFNRRGFIDVAESEIQRVSRSGREFTVVLADIDNFKSFNDRYGHACGDHVLCRVADMLKLRVRDVDRVARWGGEEFIFLLPETDAEGAAKLAEKLRESVESNIFEYGGERVGVTLTFGVAVHRKGETLDSCIARADTALYHGKARGRNRVMIGSYKGLTLVN